MTGLLGEVDLPAPIGDRWFEDYVPGSVFEFGYASLGLMTSTGRSSMGLPLAQRGQTTCTKPGATEPSASTVWALLNVHDVPDGALLQPVACGAGPGVGHPPRHGHAARSAFGSGSSNLQPRDLAAMLPPNGEARSESSRNVGAPLMAPACQRRSP